MPTTQSAASTDTHLAPSEIIAWGEQVLQHARDSLGHLQDVPKINSKFDTRENRHTLHLPDFKQLLVAVTKLVPSNQILFQIWKVDTTKCDPVRTLEFQMAAVLDEHNQATLAAALATRIKRNKR